MLGFRDAILSTIGATRRPDHDEVDETFVYKRFVSDEEKRGLKKSVGLSNVCSETSDASVVQEEVRVKDKIRVESMDPNLMAVMAKLAALEHTIDCARRCLDIAMGKEID
jgi:hypothetical protein